MKKFWHSGRLNISEREEEAMEVGAVNLAFLHDRPRLHDLPLEAIREVSEEWEATSSETEQALSFCRGRGFRVSPVTEFTTEHEAAKHRTVPREKLHWPDKKTSAPVEDRVEDKYETEVEEPRTNELVEDELKDDLRSKAWRQEQVDRTTPGKDMTSDLDDGQVDLVGRRHETEWKDVDREELCRDMMCPYNLWLYGGQTFPTKKELNEWERSMGTWQEASGTCQQTTGTRQEKSDACHQSVDIYPSKNARGEKCERLPAVDEQVLSVVALHRSGALDSPKRTTPSPSYPIITLPRSARRSGQRVARRSLADQVEVQSPAESTQSVFHKLFRCCRAAPPRPREPSPLPMKFLSSLGGQAPFPFVRFPPPATTTTASATEEGSSSSVSSVSSHSSCSSCSCSSCSASLVETPVDPHAPHAFTTEDYVKEKPKTTRWPACYGACCATGCFILFCLIGLTGLLLYLYFNTSAMREGMTTN